MKKKQVKPEDRPLTGKQTCTQCKKTEALTGFQYDENYKGVGKHRKICKRCTAKRYRAHYAKSPIVRQQKIDRCANTRMKREYGITLIDYNRMEKEQKGLCMICGGKQTGGRKKRLDIDHDHKTGQVRGLLCSMCNLAVALIENTDTQAITDYLEGYKCLQTNKPHLLTNTA